MRARPLPGAVDSRSKYERPKGPGTIQNRSACSVCGFSGRSMDELHTCGNCVEISQGDRPITMKDATGSAIYPSLANRVVVVTGGASGIGEAIVEAFAMQQAQVVFLDIQDDAAARLIERVRGAGGAAPIYRHCDLTDIEALQKTAEEVLTLHPESDVLVNNAGNDMRHAVEEVTSTLWDELMAVNLKQQFFMAQA